MRKGIMEKSSALAVATIFAGEATFLVNYGFLLTVLTNAAVGFRAVRDEFFQSPCNTIFPRMKAIST